MSKRPLGGSVEEGPIDTNCAVKPDTVYLEFVSSFGGETEPFNRSIDEIKAMNILQINN